MLVAATRRVRARWVVVVVEAMSMVLANKLARKFGLDIDLLN